MNAIAHKIIKAWDHNDGRVTVSLRLDALHGFHAVHMVIDGAEHNVTMYGNDGVVIPKGKLDTISLHHHWSERTGYRNEATGEFITAAEYLTRELPLLEGTTEGCDDDTVYPSLEAEFAHRKFMATYKAAYEDRVTEIPFTLDIRNVGKQEGHIKSQWHTLDSLDSSEGVYVLDRLSNFRDVMTKGCHKYGLRVDDLERPEFCKIEGNYVCSSSSGNHFLTSKIYRGTFEECLEMKRLDTERCEFLVRKAKEQRDRAKGIDGTTALDVLNAMESITRALNFYATKADHRSAVSRAKEYADKMAARMRTIINEG